METTGAGSRGAGAGKRTGAGCDYLGCRAPGLAPAEGVPVCPGAPGCGGSSARPTGGCLPPPGSWMRLPRVRCAHGTDGKEGDGRERVATVSGLCSRSTSALGEDRRSSALSSLSGCWEMQRRFWKFSGPQPFISSRNGSDLSNLRSAPALII